MKACISKVFRFEAAHCLPNHDGKCRQPHGHSYKAVIRVSGIVNRTQGDAKEGMVMDFADLSAVWNESLKPKLDHQDLNETLGGVVTTAENIAIWILSMFLMKSIQVQEVEVWETETSCAKVNYSDCLRDLDIGAVAFGAERMPT